MEATTEVTTDMPICGGPLPDLEVPMITTMVTCLGIEHGKLNYRIVQLASAATRLATDPDSVTANQRALQVWGEIRHDLWSHLQIEEELVFSWGAAHQAISETLLALARTLDSHVERHDGEVLPSILRALFHK